MPTFLYRAFDVTTRNALEGAVDAESIKLARALLRSRGFIPVFLHPFEEAQLAKSPWYQRFVQVMTYRPVKPQELLQFTQQLSSLLAAAIPLIEALTILNDQISNPTLRATVEQVRKDLLSGQGFSESLGKHPRVFSPLYVNLALAGEVSGRLDVMMERLSGILESSLETHQKIVGAMTYPVLVLIALLGIVVLLLTFVVPIFVQLYRGKASLPLPTLILIAVSNDLRAHFLLYALSLVFAGVAFSFFRKTPFGKPIVDRAILAVPLFGEILKAQMVNRFVRAFATVFGAGVTITNSLAACRQLVPNAVIDAVLEKAAENIQNGRTFSEPLVESKDFPRVVAQMIAVGEASGNLETMMDNAAKFSAREIDYKIKNLTTAIEPIMTIVIGIVVLGIALALYLPLFDLSKIMMKG